MGMSLVVDGKNSEALSAASLKYLGKLHCEGPANIPNSVHSRDEGSVAGDPEVSTRGEKMGHFTCCFKNVSV